ncbi:hypothetical protein [Nocardioides sp. JS614]|uniref:hypothetical protein n=1 Tax=Nocardioides sp. (strain ATCC BAA-499 / JS614) TaxID=196162 RepID=UPI000056F751|nr:hypothetical protein [Nocardioides sp. JS614]ABL83946.1 hypothetical protein Noca_4449 [Nocardioides sp. JS614]
MKRSILLSIAATATAAASLYSVAPAQAGTSANAQVTLESKVCNQIARIDAALTRVEHASAMHRLDADVRAEVRANIDADQSALADLSVQVSTADTVSEVRAIRAEVLAYRTVVYAQAVAALNAADDLAEQVDGSREDFSLDLSVLAMLDTAQASVDASVDGAVSLSATSGQAEVRAVQADLRAAARAYVTAVN